MSLVYFADGRVIEYKEVKYYQVNNCLGDYVFRSESYEEAVANRDKESGEYITEIILSVRQD